MEEKKYKYGRECVICNKPFKTNNEQFRCCYRCFKFYNQFGGIKSYEEFLEAFNLGESEKAKERYIQFVDNVKKYLEIRGDWVVDKILENPGEFLDKVKIGEKREKNKIN